MERSIKLRLSQLIQAARTTFFIFIGLLVLGILILLLSSRPEGYNLDILGVLSRNWQASLLTTISSFISFMLFIFAVFDGLFHFDSALRMGISRTQYFIISIILYLTISALSLMMKVVSQAYISGYDMGSRLFNLNSLENFIGEFAYIMLIVIIFYGVYRYGFKFLLIMVGLYVVVIGSLGIRLLATMDVYLGISIARIISTIMENRLLINSIGAVAAIILYFFLTQRMPIQD